MKMDYSWEQDIDWNNAESIVFKPTGWKTLKIEYLDAPPYVLWRIHGVGDDTKYFRSMADSLIKMGIYDFFNSDLAAFKAHVIKTIDTMEPERKQFYSKNIITLFD